MPRKAARGIEQLFRRLRELMMENKSKFDRNLHLRLVAFLVGAFPLLVWRFYNNGVQPDIWMAAYMQAGGVFGIALVGSYPPFLSRWFLKSMVPILIVHLIIQFAFFRLALGLAAVSIKPPTRMFFGFVSVAIMVEAYLALRIIDLTRPREVR